VKSWRKARNTDNFLTQIRAKGENHAQFALATAISFRFGAAEGFATFCTSFVDKIVRKRFDCRKVP